MSLRWFIATLIAVPAVLKAADHDLVVMQQLVVEAAHTDWKYLSVPGYEVISRCDDEKTEWYTAGFFRADAIQKELLAQNSILAPAVPFTAILYDRKPEGLDAASLLVPGPVSLVPTRGDHFGPYRSIDVKGSISGQDWDTFATAANLWTPESESSLTGGPLFFQDGGLLAFRLTRRRPAPPEWLITGLVQPYGLARLIPTPDRLVVPGPLWVSPSEAEADLAASRRRALDSANQTAKEAPAGTVSLKPFVVQEWAKIVLLPMSEIFRERAQQEGPPSGLWRAQAALFVRWGMLDPKQRGHFLRFAERAGMERVTEQSFRDCFGFGYSEMEVGLSAYLKAASSGFQRLSYRFLTHWPPPLPVSVKRPATDLEVARIVGDWERMCGAQFKTKRPEISQRYFQEAGKTLLRAYEAGSRDPQILAILGLYYHDVGNDGAARPLLEAASTAQVSRPAVYRVLAQLRLADARRHPGGADGKLSVDQVVGILTPIYTARRLAALPLAAYLLIAEVLDLNSVRCTPGNLGALEEGIQFYPRSALLAKAAAKVATHWDYPEQAAFFKAAATKF